MLKRLLAVVPLLCLTAALLAASPAWAATVRLPQSNAASWEAAGSSAAAPGSGSSSPSLVPVPGTTGPTFGPAPSATLGAPTFDPYATSPNAASTPPTLTPPPAPFGSPSGVSPYWQAPGSMAPPASPYLFPNTGFPGPGLLQQPPVLFPGGFGAGPAGFNWPQPEQGRYMRLFQDVRMRYTWLAGQNSLDEMTTHDVELGTTVNFPNFLFSGRPLHVSPVFVFHFWDGPDGEPLPANVYSTYLEFGWQPMLTPQFGADVVASVGVFSDFGTLTSDSLRLQGTGLLVLNLTPTLTLKGGIAYLDRVDVEYLPAAGILWQPNPQTRFDIFFPKPKLSQYLGTLGNTDIWWYLTGEYGGGSWTLESVGTMDINDIRVGGGLEWTCQSGLKSFVEAAYVFDREIVYKSGVPNQTLADTVMLRGGITY